MRRYGGHGGWKARGKLTSESSAGAYSFPQAATATTTSASMTPVTLTIETKFPNLILHPN
jgi:hypothetical protein